MTKLMLIDPDLKAYRVNYDQISTGRIAKSYDEYQEGDLVNVASESRWGFSVCKIVEVNPTIDWENPEELPFIAGKVDSEAHAELVKMQERVLEKMRAGQRRLEQQKILQGMQMDDIQIELEKGKSKFLAAPEVNQDNAD